MFRYARIIFISIALVASMTCALMAEQLLPKSVQEQLKKEFKQVTAPVTLVVFTQELRCVPCGQNDQLVDELSKLSPKIKVEKHEFQKDVLTARNYGVDKIPAIVPVGARTSGVRFFGIPSGYEFSNLIEAIKDASRGGSELSSGTIARLERIKKPVHIQVLVTPTCPYCTKMVRLAHQFAMHNPLIRADMVELNEFPYLSQKYDVVGVPMTVINEKIKLSGALPEEKFLEAVEKAGK